MCERFTAAVSFAQPGVLLCERFSTCFSFAQRKLLIVRTISRLCGWRSSFGPPSISPACVYPGQRVAPLKGMKGGGDLSLTIENRARFRSKSSRTIESASCGGCQLRGVRGCCGAAKSRTHRKRKGPRQPHRPPGSQGRSCPENVAVRHAPPWSGWSGTQPRSSRRRAPAADPWRWAGRYLPGRRR